MIHDDVLSSLASQVLSSKSWILDMGVVYILIGRLPNTLCKKGNRPKPISIGWGLPIKVHTHMGMGRSPGPSCILTPR